VTSPYPAPDGGHETLARDACAEPGCRVRPSQPRRRTGNAAYTGIDPYFDDLFLMAAERRYLSVDRVVSTDELVKAVPPQALLVNRMMVDQSGGSTGRRPLHHRGNRIMAATRNSNGTTPKPRQPTRLADVRAYLSVRRRSRIPGGRA